MRSPLAIRVAAGAAALVLAAAACSSDDDTSATDTSVGDTTTTAQEASDEAPSDPTIVDIAAGEEDFSTLVSAVTAAGLVDTLSGSGPFTVFAPTNAAFEAIPEADLNSILADEDQLTEILTYHVLPGEVLSTDLQPSQSPATVQGDSVDIEVADGQATINGCNIVTTDIQASNGVIHVIDCVLTP
jgi:uncharacterized surface protein with fasciclin (FAS1) repeats